MATIKGNPLNSRIRPLAIVSAILLSLVCFQNCSGGFQSLGSVSLGSQNFSGQKFSALSGAEGIELIRDPEVRSGFNARAACLQPDLDPSCGANAPFYPVNNPNYPSNSKPWRLAQWGSVSSIPATPVTGGDHYSYSNDYKSVKLFNDGRVEMSVNAQSELGGKYFEFNTVRKWPHLLLEQDISAPGLPGAGINLSNIKALNFAINIHLIYNNQNRAPGYDVAKHTSQFPIYFTVQNLNPASPGHGQFVWLGIPAFEERSVFSPHNIMMDEGTKSLIYTIGYTSFASESVHSGKLVRLAADILPFAKDAVIRGSQSGILKSGDISDYKIGGMNMGFEITGLNITTMQFSGLSLRATSWDPVVNPAPAPDPLTPEGFYKVSGTDAIFYSNGTSAYCVFDSWNTFVEWGGPTHPRGLGSRVSLPTNMRHDGACPSRAPAPTPEGFYRIINTDAIFYSNGVDAICVFTSWDTFVRWGGTTRPVGYREALPQSMRNDGACP